MVTGAEIDSEGTLLISEKVPAGSVESVAFDQCDADAFPTKFACVPSLAVSAPCKDGVEAYEEKQLLRGKRMNGDDGLEGDVDRALWDRRLDDVGVAPGDGAEFVGVGAGENAGGHRGVCKAEGAGREERTSLCLAHEDLQRAPREGIFFTVDLMRVREVTRRRNERSALENFSGPDCAGRLRRS